MDYEVTQEQLLKATYQMKITPAERWYLECKLEQWNTPDNDSAPPLPLKPEHRPRTWNDEGLCPKFNGGWITVYKGKRKVMVPAGCGKRYCGTCGKRIWAKTRTELVEGFRHNWPGEIPRLMTLTFRGRRRLRPGDNLSPPETWDAFLLRWGVGVDEIPELDHTMTGEQMLNHIAAQPTAHQVLLRAQMTSKEWLKYMTAAFAALRYAWRGRFGENLTYMRTWELTTQGIPHIHAAYKKPKGVESAKELEQVRRWLTRTWARIIGENPEQVQTHAGHWMNKFGGSVGAAVEYPLKYSMKDWMKQKKIIHQRKGLQIGPNNDWTYNLKRLDTSQCWGKADVGDEGTFIHERTGQTINRREYKRAQNLLRYHCRTRPTNYWECSMYPGDIDKPIRYRQLYRPDYTQRDRLGNPKWRPCGKKVSLTHRKLCQIIKRALETQKLWMGRVTQGGYEGRQRDQSRMTSVKPPLDFWNMVWQDEQGGLHQLSNVQSDWKQQPAGFGGANG